jgi:hypothetical protein
MDVIDNDLIRIDAMFRDTHRDTDGAESVIHEYTLDAVLDRSSLSVLFIEAQPRVLPWVECPLAARSADALVSRTSSS